MCLPPSFPARPVTTEMFAASEKVRFAARETMEVYLSTRAEVFAAACGVAGDPARIARRLAATYATDTAGGFEVDLRAADAQLYALACGVYSDTSCATGSG